ncbi:MAG: hypothetical protein COZ06_26540 [Armatimonadetes bacterium CG_4_10_14_3_um_filter_66_18]|nr:radical SAM protein [Armatimonadota bacterium]OIP11806.1 MAG: hypothetical protein AUJ96_01675 [Armatimonadetes bacterium CG2_30_66_41]PIU94850.1 MAG: hypothetical protein COS65_05400 [Armatimonadetes bacterium CG06_land_8_20_14_3_00_66_21]PIX40062.1 MAG: hypothetical protein COZ57_26905 [Armatimonadetes bacterium CG_4_8_14_3_um_filter_66_20]PIY41471.1 MAG: hypothetical protein COZ06_26540 [Armatimonadetes bacterium CG_4_10_14_3_um_filter_66_18]PIZ40851.1 MAG: hypothetical protein COY42_203
MTGTQLRRTGPRNPKLKRIAWLEPGRLPFGWDDQNIYKGVLFPRAGPRMAAVLDSLGYDTTVISGELSPLDVDEIARDFDVACLSLISATAPHGLILGRQLAERGVPVVAGGYHFAHSDSSPKALTCTAQALQFVPYVVRGEGYQSLPLLLSALEHRQPLSGIPGISFLSAGVPVHIPPAPLLSKDFLNQLPLPAWNKVRDHDRMAIFSAHGMQGCPRKCSWCAVWPRDGRQDRNLDPTRLVDEIENALALSHLQHLFMSADNFPAFRNWAVAVCEEILRRGLKLEWTCQAEVPAALQPELVDLMKRAGCVRWAVGFESVSQEALKSSQKRQTVGNMAEAVRALHRAGIAVHGMFICGLPGDTAQTIRETVKWAKRVGIDTAQFLCLIDLPGSQDYDERKLDQASFRPFEEPYDLLNWFFVNGHYARLGNESLSLQQVQQAAIESTRSFYSLPRVLLPMVWPNWPRFRAERRQGQPWGRSLGKSFMHNWITFAQRLRGWTLTRQWERAPLNRLYRQLLREPDRAAELTRGLLDALPGEWGEVLQRVAVEPLAAQQEAA